jgi:RimJ/RimL family protein N-acetyltransferase
VPAADDARIETARLLLRPMTPEDLDDFVVLHEDPEVTRFITAFDRAASERRLRETAEEWERRGHGIFAVETLADARFIGRASVKYWPQFEETELGWALRREAWGHGYATEAARALAGWAFERLEDEYLTAMIGPGNDRSLRVAERLGFTPLREDELLGDPVTVYALSRSQSLG